MSNKLDLLQTELDNFAKQLSELQKQMSTLFQTSLKEICQEIFQAYPELVAMQWNQYTPYFNDGDTCEFSVNDITILISKCGDGSCDKIEEGTQLYEYDDTSLYEIEEYLGRDSKFQSVVKFQKILCKNSDTLQDIFGDHCMVTITREGVTTVDYEHE